MNIKLVILFGSQASYKSNANSDTDVAVLLDRAMDLEDKAKLQEKLATKLGILEDKIDLIDLWFAPPLLQHQVAQNGRLIEGEEIDFIRFKVLAWKRYQDTAKFRRIREQVLNKEYAQ